MQKLLDREQLKLSEETENWKALMTEQANKKERIQLRWNILVSKLHLIKLDKKWRDQNEHAKSSLYATPNNRAASKALVKFDSSNGKQR